MTAAGAPRHLRGMTTDESQKSESTDELEDEEFEEASHSDEEEEFEAMPESRPRAANPLNSIRNLWIVISGLTFLLIVSMLFNKAPQRMALPADDPSIAAVKSVIEMEIAELNRQRAELNWPPLAGGGEDISAITDRLRKDAETLVSLIENNQTLSAEKDRLLTEKNVALIRSEQVRESLTTELARAQTHTDGTARLEADLSDALARANRLADELAGARKLIAELSEDTSSAEIETLKRRLDEVTRARDFFELRVQQLEASRQNKREEVEVVEEEN